MIDFSKIKTLYIDGKEVKTFSVDGHEAWRQSEEDSDFKIIALDDGTDVYFERNGAAVTHSFKYSINGGQEQTFDTSSPAQFSLNAGDVLRIQTTEEGLSGLNNIAGPYNSWTGFRCDQSKRVIVKGALSSLIQSDSVSSWAFNRLFTNMSGLVDASQLVLPSSNAPNAYVAMFMNCSQLSAAPTICQTTAPQACYDSMFLNCSSLLEAPAMSALEVQTRACNSMFENCTSLTVAHVPPASAVLSTGYQRMFMNCTSLLAAPELPAETLSGYCYASMFNGCTSLTSAPSALPATQLQTNCYNMMFNNCYSLTKAPEISGLSGAYQACFQMFGGCSSLAMPPSKLMMQGAWNNEFQYMFGNCSALSAAPEMCLSAYGEWACRYMFNSCISLRKAPELSAQTVGKRAYHAMFTRTGIIDGPSALPASAPAISAYSAMFTGCSSLTSAPAICATTYSDQVCYYMFGECISLSTPPVVHKTTSNVGANAFAFMFTKCSSLTSTPSFKTGTPGNSSFRLMAQNCSGLKEAHLEGVPACTANGAFDSAFLNCTSLSSVNVGFTTWNLACSPNWLNNVAQTGVFKIPDTSLVTERSARCVPAGWTVMNLPQIMDYVQTNSYSLDTGYKPTVNTSLSACLSGNSGGTCFIGFNYGNDQQDYRVFNAGTIFYFDMGGGSSYGSRIWKESGWDMTKWAEISAWNYGFRVLPDGGSEHTATGTQHNTVDWDANGTINIAGNGVGANCDICVKGLKIYESGVLVKDFKPAVDSNSVACLYEEVENIFYYPTGGAWTAIS